MERIENIQTKKVHDPDSRYTEGGAVDPHEAPKHKLDSPEVLDKHKRLEDWFAQERSTQAESRFQMALDHDFYDGLQYSEEDAQELMERGQAPLVYNEVKPTIDWVIGTERRTKFDYNILPRREEDVGLSSVKREVIKYISDINRLTFERSSAFKESSISGLSWTETGIRGDNDDDPIYGQHESWRNVWYDSNSRKLDYSDARYLFRRRVADLDVAIAMYQERERLLREAALDQDTFVSQYDDFLLGTPLSQGAGGKTPISSYARYGGIGSNSGSSNRKMRVELIEAWVRTPVRVQKLRGDLFDGEQYDKNNPEHVAAVGDGVVSTFDALEMRMEVTVFCSAGVLFDGVSPYRHNRFSLTPMWCYRRGRDNSPYGLVRNIRDPQEDLNKRASKALFILSTNRVIADEGAVEDLELLREEAARPDGIIIKKYGKDLSIGNDNQLAHDHMALMDRDGNAIRNAGGVTDENLGRGSNAQSGKAILARQTQGSVVTSEVFDNYLLNFQLDGENLLSLAEQYYAKPKVIRIAGKRAGKFDWIKVNQPQEDGSYLNDITQSKADFIVDEQDYRESMRQAMFEQMMEMVGKMPPELAIKLLDLVFEFSDIQGKDEIVKRIRKLTGEGGDDEEKSPEQLQAEQAAAQEEQAQQELIKQTAEAQLQMLKAKVAQLEAQSKKIDADSLTQMVTAMYTAMQAGQIIATVPGVAPVADAILQGAGYQDQNGQDANIPAPTSPAQAAMPQQLPPLQQTDGAQAGIQTPGNDGVITQ